VSALLDWHTRRSGGGCRATDREGARAHLRRQMDQENFQGALDRMKPKFALLAALVAGLLQWPRLHRRRLPQLNPLHQPRPPPRPHPPHQPQRQPRRLPFLFLRRRFPPGSPSSRSSTPSPIQRRPARGGGPEEEVPAAADQLQNLAAEIDSLKKQLQAAPTTLPDTERAAR